MSPAQQAPATQPPEYAQAVFEALIDEYGIQQRTFDADPLDMLIGTILSANTNDVNSGRAFRELKERYGGNWGAVRYAPLEDIKQAIRVAGMYNQKAPNIVNTLTRIYDGRGEYSLDFLEEMDVTDAMTYLTALPGVGHKTASIVLLFRYGKATFPVDTHVQRISQRLGVVPSRASAEQVKRAWESLLPDETFFTLHVNLIQHGRTICHARKPKCDRCVLFELCDFAQQRAEWELG